MTTLNEVPAAALRSSSLTLVHSTEIRVGGDLGPRPFQLQQAIVTDQKGLFSVKLDPTGAKQNGGVATEQ